MKKYILLLTAFFFLSMAVTAQEEAVQNNKKFLLAFSAGPSFPVGPFASTDTTSEIAGFAKTGFNLNVNFGYHATENFAIASTFLYSNYSLDISKFGEGVGANHWQYYGVLVGPMVSFSSGENANFGLKALAGVTNVNSPSLKYEGTVIVKEDWSAAFAVQAGLEYRYNFNNGMYFLTNLDYNYMKPKFKIVITDDEISGLPRSSESTYQQIGALNLNIGIGIKF